MSRLERIRDALRPLGEAPELPFAQYASDPVGFASDVLGVEPWSHQRRALEAIAANRRVSWRSCHGAGKTDTAAIAAVWHTVTRAESLTIITAPSYRQVRSVLWRAIRRLVRGASMPLGGDLHEVPEHGWQFADGRALIGFAAGDAERFAGYHAPSVLLIVDEASGVEQAIFEAAKGVLTGDSRLMLIGNPTRLSGEFFESHGRKAQLWQTLHTSAYDSPNVTGTEPTIPGLIDRTLIDEMALDYGEESAVFSVRVLGAFPTQAENAVISLALVEASREAWLETMKTRAVFGSLGPLEIGVDVARFGDDATCIVVRRGRVALEPVVFRKLDAVQVAERVRQVVAEHRRPSDDRITVRVDATGVGGGVVDILKRSEGLRVVGVDFGAAAPTAAHQRTRDALWFQLRDWMKDGGCVPPDTLLEAELIAPTYTFSPAQKLVVEPKDETRKRLRRSPDRADALALAVYRGRSQPSSFGEYTPMKSRRI